MGSDDAHREAAVAALAAREYERAGDEYTRAAWTRLARPREGLSPFEPDEKGWVGRGLQSLAAATAAYRVAGRSDRATHRAVAGVAAARDLANALDGPAQGACLDEFVADFKTIGGLDGAAEAYESAATAYEDVGPEVDDPRGVTTTPLFQAAAETTKQLARGPANGEIAVTWEDLHGPDPSQAGSFLSHRVRFKSQRVPSLIERTVADGYLAAPRGTTEYDNANHRCPDCGSTDVNWVADAVVCLRCSTPMGQR